MADNTNIKVEPFSSTSEKWLANDIETFIKIKNINDVISCSYAYGRKDEYDKDFEYSAILIYRE